MTMTTAILFYAVTSFAKDYITTDRALYEEMQKSHPEKISVVAENNGIYVLEISSEQKELIPLVAHQLNRCGGFFAHDSLQSAMDDLQQQRTQKGGEGLFTTFQINAVSEVKPAIDLISEINIQEQIEEMSRFQNRYYLSKTGIESQQWLFEKWKSLTAHRTDVSVELVAHNKWPQPSVRLRIKGDSAQTIILGGHGDSIAGYWGREEARAPGADDNASGISSLTEVIRVLMETNFRPTKTLEFFSYAAEEVGLLGSRAIAKNYRSMQREVIGVMQLDMTNYKGSEIDMTLISDHTNEAQNVFVGQLIDTYLTNIRWGRDNCGYGCSDHASWNAEGFPASFPFEAKTKNMNRQIHSSRDTIEESGNQAGHAAKFAKLALAFMIEMDR